jgi:hypothetical protein
MSVVQIGAGAAELYADDVAAVLQAALELPVYSSRGSDHTRA